MKEMTEMSLMDKNIKNTAVMAELFELLCCPSSHVPESELSRRLEAHHGFVPKIGHRSGKNNKNHSGGNQMASRDMFFVFLPLKRLKPEKVTGLVKILSESLLVRKIDTDAVSTLTRVQFL